MVEKKCILSIILRQAYLYFTYFNFVQLYLITTSVNYQLLYFLPPYIPLNHYYYFQDYIFILARFVLPFLFSVQSSQNFPDFKSFSDKLKD